MENADMYSFDYRFYPLRVDDDFLDVFMAKWTDFTIALTRNGQCLSKHDNAVFSNGVYILRLIALEKDSLEEKHYNSYCKKDMAVLLDVSAKAPDYELIDENVDVGDVCECTESPFYVVRTSLYAPEPPVICGCCSGSVPLYRLPKSSGDDEYFDVLQWQKVYWACHMLFQNGMGEHYGYKMMHDPKSALSEEGRRICAFWEQHIGKPFYYFLFKYYGKNKKVCPVCGDDWVNKDAAFGYDYVCHKCRLVSEDIG